MSRLRALPAFAGGPLAAREPELKVRARASAPTASASPCRASSASPSPRFPGYRPGDVLETLPIRADPPARRACQGGACLARPNLQEDAGARDGGGLRDHRAEAVQHPPRPLCRGDRAGAARQRRTARDPARVSGGLLTGAETALGCAGSTPSPALRCFRWGKEPELASEVKAVVVGGVVALRSPRKVHSSTPATLNSRVRRREALHLASIRSAHPVRARTTGSIGEGDAQRAGRLDVEIRKGSGREADEVPYPRPPAGGLRHTGVAPDDVLVRGKRLRRRQARPRQPSPYRPQPRKSASNMPDNCHFLSLFGRRRSSEGTWLI